jgi:PPIC-type PPIASE domain
MIRILKEPLLHFTLLGAAIFLAYGLVSRRSGDEPGRIVITQGQVASMAESFTRTWQRPPTSEELQGLVRDRVRDEVYAREAMALGLDRDDTVIRRRLRQKMEFVAEDVATRAEPSDAELTAYLQANPDAYRVAERFTFRQVYLNPEKHGANLGRDAAELLAGLNQTGEAVDAAALGDPSLLEPDLAALSGSEVAQQFGEAFASQLRELAPGRWQGPFESGYGVHLVFLRQRTEGHLPELAEVREAVQRDWSNAQRLEANETLYQAMLQRYAVTIEPLPASEETKLAEVEAK